VIQQQHGLYAHGEVGDAAPLQLAPQVPKPSAWLSAAWAQIIPGHTFKCHYFSRELCCL